MTAAARRRQRGGDENLDVELIDLPPAVRWREWMLRVEAAIFASARPVPREALVRLVGGTCRFDDLIADLIHELRGRPYDLTLVAGGYALRTKTRFGVDRQARGMEGTSDHAPVWVSLRDEPDPLRHAISQTIAPARKRPRSAPRTGDATGAGSRAASADKPALRSSTAGD
jgi:hypothetical protein